MPEVTTRVREAVSADLERIAEIHCAALSQDLLPRLGKPFLVRDLYPLALRSAHSFILVAEREDLVGFVVFSVAAGDFARELRRKWRRIAASLLRSSSRDLWLARDLLDATLRCRLEGDYSREELERLPELFVIAIDPRHQGERVGGRLVQAGLEALARRVSAEVCSVKTSSEQARRFYRAQGFEEVGGEVRGRRRFHVLTHPL